MEISYFDLFFIILLFNLLFNAFEIKFSFLYKYEKLINNIQIENFLINLLDKFKNKKILISFNNQINNGQIYLIVSYLLEIFNFVCINLISNNTKLFYVYQINKSNNEDFGVEMLNLLIKI